MTNPQDPASPSKSPSLPEGWVETTLGELRPEFQNGLSKREGENGEPTIVLRLADVKGYDVSFDSVRKIALSKQELEKYVVSHNDLLIIRVNGSTDHVGRFIYKESLRETVAYCDHFIRMRVQKEFVNSKFLQRLSSSDVIRRQIELNFVTTAGQKTINQGHISNLSIPLPPLSEQKRIADKLDALLSRVDAGRERLERVPKLVKQFRQAVLSAAVSGELTREWRGGGDAKWEEVCGHDVFAFVTSGSRGWAEYYSHSGSIFLRIGNLNHGNISLDLSSIQYVNPPKGTEGTRTRVQTDDILISITADVGMVAHVSTDIGEAYINQHICLARPKQENSSKFLAYFLAAPNGGLAYLRNIQRGATKAGLTLGDIRETTFLLPPLPEQAEIVRRVEALFAIADRLEARYQTALASFQRLTPALLGKAFRGELVAQDPADEPASVLLERVRAQRAAEGTGPKRGRKPGKAAGQDGAEPKRRGRPPKAQAEGPPIPEASSYEDAVRRLEAQKQARAGQTDTERAQGRRLVGLFEE